MKKNHCVIHGEMTIENAYACNNPNGTIRLRCKECCHARRIVKYQENREENIKKASEWKKANKDRINAQTKIDRKNNPEKYLQWSLNHRTKYGQAKNDYEVSRRKGLSKEDYYNLIESQDNKCALCGKEETRTRDGRVMRLCLDHDHKTGVLRSLLCHSCNTGIGKFKDSIEILQSAITYLKKHEKNNTCNATQTM